MPVLLSKASEEAIALAVEEASDLGHRSWASEHVLLALAQLGAVRAGEILNALGATESRIRELLIRHRPPETPRRERAKPNPSGESRPPTVPTAADFERVWLHTRWLAAYFRPSRADTVHLLLGTLWDEKPDRKVFRELGLRFEDVYREATGREPPDEVLPPRAVYVSKEDLMPVVRALPQVLPAGASFGFAEDDECAWLTTHSDIDLSDYVGRALASANGS